MTLDATAIAVAVIGVIGVCIAAWFSYKAAKAVKTTNGHTSGELLEFLAEEVSLLRVWIVEHMRDNEIHRRDG